ncbi:MAG TPA: type I DNA topoisomerase [Nitrospirae bacterium]|nr:DNA topoisomerase 1 [bacterium BMS3Abin06]HDH12263.1 type I DNA topoisomerase [Nitrospirota bacterium]HDZ01139.1 type I DNA topoisomerase [Nitrospirota bacterium]
MKSLLIVESPTKVKTLSKFLGKNFTIKASVGHIKDLPKKELGVDVENNLAPTYVVIEGKEKILKDLKKAAKTAEKIFLGPDPDREGEAIAWHIAGELNGASGKVYRVEFNEITEKAVTEAIRNPRKVDMNLVDAQQARRILDRLVGYKLSPLLWRKVRRGLSAGRVQSVALRLVVDREKEIEAFKPKEYWSITATLEGKEPPPFDAKLFHIDQKKADIKNEAEALGIVDDLKGKSFTVKKIEKKKRRRNPAPPFITSTLQQDAARKFRFTAKKTMLIAQQLYEGIELGGEGSAGLITYMRTDSVKVASEAQEEARALIRGEFGKDYLPQKPPVYKSKKSAQEAHEAIRPTAVIRTPSSIKSYLSRDQYNLYQLIWNRFVASQMHHALLEQTSIDIVPESGNAGEAEKYIFRATGTVVKFPGFMKLYTESGDNGSDEEGLLPQLAEGDILKTTGILPKQHFTQPPPRYSEATLVRELEAKAIGRPSTYATILSKIQDRKYTEKIEGRFKPTELGVLVSDLLVERFPELMDYNFTAKMEDNLDRIEEGGLKWVNIVMDFYKPFDKDLAEAMESLGRVKPEDIPTDQVCEKCGKPMVIKWGRHGRFIACTGYPDCKNTMPLENQNGEGKAQSTEVQETDEKCEKCGSPMVLKSGRFGRFLACSKYPDCKTTKPISTGIKCPDDGGEIVERMTKKGKLFFSCGNYPKCKFASWYKPVNKSCPECGAGVLVEKRTKKEEVLVCLKKECKYKEELQKDPAEQSTVVQSSSK